jgi:hypothetical protein
MKTSMMIFDLEKEMEIGGGRGCNQEVMCCEQAPPSLARKGKKEEGVESCC